MALSRRTGLLALLLLVAAFALHAARLGPDATWDLRNYHLYDPFALLHHKLGFDIVPAQQQTFLAPQLDLIGYAIRHVLNGNPALFNAVMSLPTAIACFLATLITLVFLPPAMPGRLIFALAVAFIGATGAAGWPTIATSSSESIPACFSLAGLLLILTAAESRRPALRLGLAGLLLGIAAGFKLTSLSFCIGGTAAALLAPLPWRAKWRGLMGFALFGLAGTALIGAPWWIVLTLRYHNPLFPYLNQIFHSPDYLPLAMSDERFKPHGLLQALFYPLYWALAATPRVTELPMRDPRFAIALLAAVAAAIRLGLDPASRPAGRQAAMLIAFFLFSYLFWEKEFSIFRYLATIEGLTGTVVVAAWRVFDGAAARPLRAWAGAAALGLLCIAATIYPDWRRAPPGPAAVRVGPPQLPPGALVILLDGTPMAYVAAFEPPGVRFVGANNNIVSPGQASRLNAAVGRAIAEARGPLWGLRYPPAAATDAQTLAAYRLRIAGACLPVLSNIDSNSLQLCPLARRH